MISTLKSTTLSKLVPIFSFTILMSILFPSFAFADGGVSSGVDAILRSSSLDGDDSMRQTVAGYANRPISFIITLTGFFIITFSFMKWVLTLLYLTFPDMFDKIDTYKTTRMQGGFKEKSPIDFITYFFALITPNIKPLTDYAKNDNEIDKTPLEYIKSSLPKVMLFIVIGAMIYDGQARNFMAKGADVGLVVGSIIERHDTVAAVSDFIGGSDRWVFTYDTATQEGKNKEKIAKAVQQHLHGLNPNIKSVEHGDAVGRLSEKITDSIVADMTNAAKKGGINSFADIVSFKLTITGRTTQITQGASVSKGSGLYVYPLGTDTDARIVLDTSNKKFVVIHYSQIVDKDNRNFLFEATTSTKTNNGQ